MDIEIRPVREEDLPDLLPLMRAYSEFYAARPSDRELEAMARGFLVPGSGGTQLIARDLARRAVGHATILWTWETTLAEPLAVMEDLYVERDVRGLGVGRALLEACRDIAARKGVTALDWSTAPDNLTAQRLYDTTGAGRGQWISYRLPTRRPAP